MRRCVWGCVDDHTCRADLFNKWLGLHVHTRHLPFNNTSKKKVQTKKVHGVFIVEHPNVLCISKCFGCQYV